MLLYIYLGISVITWVLYILADISITYKFKNRYPNLVAPKLNWAGELGAHLRLLLGCFVPLVNIALLWVIIFNYSEFERKTISKVLSECTPKEDVV